MPLPKKYPERVNIPATAEMKNRLREMSERAGLDMTIIARKALDYGLDRYEDLLREPEGVLQININKEVANG